MKSPTRDLSDVLDGERAGILAARKWAETLKLDLQPDHPSQFDVGWNAALDAMIRDLSPQLIVLHDIAEGE